MRLRSLAHSVVLLAMLASASNVSATEKEFEITLYHRAEVGQQWQLTESGTEVMTTIWKDLDGKPMQPIVKKRSVEIVGRTKVLAVGSMSGSATKIELTVDKLTLDGNSLARPGTILVIENLGDSVKYTLDGRPADKDVETVLSVFMPVASPKAAVSLEQVGQPDSPKKVGESWQVDQSQLVKCYAGADFGVAEKDSSLTLKLAAVRDTPSGPLFRIDSTETITALPTDWRNSVKSNGAVITAEAKTEVPQDLIKHAQIASTQKSKYVGEFSSKGADGKVRDYQFTAEQQIVITSTPVSE
jgi:hypothetical protein